MKAKYKKENLEPIIKKSRNYSDVLKYLGMSIHGNSRETIKKYVNTYKIDTRHFESSRETTLRINKEIGMMRRIPLKNILIENSSYKWTSNLKIKLYDEGLKKRNCELCGQGELWKGKKISLILDHINGINNDNRIENLQIVCPNCNASLPTYCRGHKKKLLTDIENKNRKKEIITKIALKQRKNERPPYDLLIDEIEKLGYSAVGRKYGVSDNSIRKWVKFYENYENI